MYWSGQRPGPPAPTRCRGPHITWAAVRQSPCRSAPPRTDRGKPPPAPARIHSSRGPPPACPRAAGVGRRSSAFPSVGRRQCSASQGGELDPTAARTLCWRFGLALPPCCRPSAGVAVPCVLCASVPLPTHCQLTRQVHVMSHHVPWHCAMPRFSTACAPRQLFPRSQQPQPGSQLPASCQHNMLFRM